MLLATKPLPSDFLRIAKQSDINIGNTDILLIGDGSGTINDKPCGWFCYAYNNIEEKINIFYGGTSGGTNNFAELFPYIQALWHFEQKKVFYRVEIISDSELTVKCGNGDYARNANLALWASIDCFANNGFTIHWNHIPRNSNALHKACDSGSRTLRNVLEKCEAQLDNT